jgi:hypothetical protein
VRGLERLERDRGHQALRPAAHVAAEGVGEKLAAEAHAQDGEAVLDRGA